MKVLFLACLLVYFLAFVRAGVGVHNLEFAPVGDTVRSTAQLSPDSD